MLKAVRQLKSMMNALVANSGNHFDFTNCFTCTPLVWLNSSIIRMKKQINTNCAHEERNVIPIKFNHEYMSVFVVVQNLIRSSTFKFHVKNNMFPFTFHYLLFDLICCAWLVSCFFLVLCITFLCQ